MALSSAELGAALERRNRLPLTMSEADWQTRVIDYAHLRGWLVTHFRPARTAHGWATPLSGDIGWPDLALARDGVFIAAELKRHGAAPTPGQRKWLEALGTHARLWTPAHWPEVMEELK
jgi:hypothetical protein